MHVDAEPAFGDVADDRGDRAERDTLIASGEPAHERHRRGLERESLTGRG